MNERMQHRFVFTWIFFPNLIFSCGFFHSIHDAVTYRCRIEGCLLNRFLPFFVQAKILKIQSTNDNLSNKFYLNFSDCNEQKLKTFVLHMHQSVFVASNSCCCCGCFYVDLYGANKNDTMCYNVLEEEKKYFHQQFHH